MPAALVAIMLSLPAEPEVKVDAVFAKVGPDAKTPGRSQDQTRAVVLIHGLGLHPLNGQKAGRAALRTWQQSDSVLVKEMAPHADVYALAYAQTVAVEKVHHSVGLAEHVKALK